MSDQTKDLEGNLPCSAKILPLLTINHRLMEGEQSRSCIYLSTEDRNLWRDALWCNHVFFEILHHQMHPGLTEINKTKPRFSEQRSMNLATIFVQISGHQIKMLLIYNGLASYPNCFMLRKPSCNLSANGPFRDRVQF